MAQVLKNAWQPFVAAGERAMAEERLEDAEANFHAALVEAELCSNADECLATTFELLSAVYLRAKQLELAEEFTLKNLRIKQNSAAFSQLDVVRVLVKLSKIYYWQNKLAAAAYTTNRVLELSEQCLGCSHPAVGLVAQQLADLYTDLGNYHEAEQLYQRALKLQKDQFSGSIGAALPQLVQTLRGYAALLSRTHRFAEAQNLLQMCGLAPAVAA